MRMYPALLALTLAAPALAQPSSEWLAQGPLPGFAPAVRETDGADLALVRRPTGETADRWTRMVTIHRFAAVPSLDVWVQAYTSPSSACPAARYARPRWLEIEGRRAVDLRGDCARDMTGEPLSFFVRAIGSGTALHVATVAFRRVPSEADVAWARAHLETVTLCTRDIATPACRARPD